MSQRKYIDGEEEQMELLAPITASAAKELGYLMRMPPKAVADCLAWVAREAFRLGYQHAHSRSTEPVPGLVDPPDE
jgi:hypothetical protein